MKASDPIAMTNGWRKAVSGVDASGLEFYASQYKQGLLDPNEWKLVPVDSTDVLDINDSYILMRMQKQIDAAQAVARSEAQARRAAETKLAAMQRAMELTVQAKQRELDAVQAALIVTRAALDALEQAVPVQPTPKVTYIRWHCLDDIAHGDAPDDKRVLTACQKAGWVSEAGELTEAGKTILAATDEPAVPRPRETVATVKARLRVVELERDDALEQLDQILGVVEAPADHLHACVLASRMVRDYRHIRAH